MAKARSGLGGINLSSAKSARVLYGLLRKRGDDQFLVQGLSHRIEDVCGLSDVRFIKPCPTDLTGYYCGNRPIRAFFIS